MRSQHLQEPEAYHLADQSGLKKILGCTLWKVLVYSHRCSASDCQEILLLYTGSAAHQHLLPREAIYTLSPKIADYIT